MSYVIQSHTIHAILQERNRTPLGKVAAWFYSRFAGTFVQSFLNFLYEDSAIARVACAISLGLIVGAVFDFTIQISFPSLGVMALSCAALAAVAGAAAGGLGGAITSVLWGWIIGGLADSVASELASDQASRIRFKVLAWLLTAVLGWLIGSATSWLYERIAEDHKRLRRLLDLVTLVTVIVSFSVLIWRVGSHLGFSALAARFLERVSRSLHHWLNSSSLAKFLLGAVTFGAIAFPVRWFFYWVRRCIRYREFANPWHSITWQDDEETVVFWLILVALALWGWRLTFGLP